MLTPPAKDFQLLFDLNCSSARAYGQKSYQGQGDFSLMQFKCSLFESGIFPVYKLLYLGHACADDKM